VCYVRMEYAFSLRKESEYRNLMFMSLMECFPNLTHKLFDLQTIKYFYKVKTITLSITYTSALGFESIHSLFIIQTQPEKHVSTHTECFRYYITDKWLMMWLLLQFVMWLILYTYTHIYIYIYIYIYTHAHLYMCTYIYINGYRWRGGVGLKGVTLITSP